MSEPRLDFVAGEFSPHNLPMQALLGLLGFGERITTMLAGLPIAETDTEIEPGEHPLDLALLGLLGLHASSIAALERRGLTPDHASADPPELAEPEPATQTDALRRLLR